MTDTTRQREMDAKAKEAETENDGCMQETNGGIPHNQQNGGGDDVKLKRPLGLLSGTAIIVGTMIGSGIFISPKGVLTHTESVGMSLVVWSVCGIIGMFGALCFAELGTIIPRSGGEYAYLHVTFGNLAAFLFSWTANLILKPSTLAIIMLACAEYALQPFFEGTACSPPPMAVKLFAACGICLVVFVNCISAKLASFCINFFTVAKLVALVIIILVGFIQLIKGDTEHINPVVSFEGSSPRVFAYGIAFYQGLWAYDGWNQLNYVTEELQNPMKNLPRAIVLGIPLVTLIYILTNISYFAVLSPVELLASNAVAVTFADRTLGVMAWIIPMAVVFSTFGASMGVVYSSGRLPYVAAREGHMISLLGMAHVKFKTPIPSTFWLGGIALVMINIGNINTLINYFSFSAWLFYGCAISALIVLRFTHPEWKRPIKVPIIIPIFMICAAAYFVIAPIINDPAIEILYACLFILAGILFYIPFVHFKYELPCMEKLTIFLQKLMKVVPSGYNTEG